MVTVDCPMVFNNHTFLKIQEQIVGWKSTTREEVVSHPSFGIMTRHILDE